MQIGRADELGSGVRNVYKYGILYGNKNPVFEEGDVFKNIIYINGNSGISTLDTRNNTEQQKSKAENNIRKLNDAVKSRLKSEVISIFQNSGLSLPQIMQKFSIKRATAQRDMKILRDADFIAFRGAPKTGKYVITQRLKQIINS